MMKEWKDGMLVEGKSKIEYRHFFVKAQFRRHGIGRAAIQWLQQNAMQLAPRIRLDVLVGNKAAIAFWRAVGFQDYCLTMEM